MVSDCIRSANVGVLLSMFFGGAVVLCNLQRGPAKVSRIVVWVFGLEGGATYGEELFEGGLLGACFGHCIWYML